MGGLLTGLYKNGGKEILGILYLKSLKNYQYFVSLKGFLYLQNYHTFARFRHLFNCQERRGKWQNSSRIIQITKGTKSFSMSKRRPWEVAKLEMLETFYMPKVADKCWLQMPGTNWQN